MSKKIALVAFNGEPMCFAHVLLNALDMHQRGHEVKLVIEGAATKCISALAADGAPFAPLYAQVREKGLIDCVCEACAAKMESLEAAKAQNLPLCGEMKGHPALAKYFEAGYEVISF